MSLFMKRATVPIFPDAGDLLLGGKNTVAIRYQEQKQTEWCWATCAAMAGEYCKNQQYQQCGFAADLHGGLCCSEPLPNGCNRPCKVGDVGQVYDSISVASTLINNSVPFSKLQDEIGASRPVEIGVAWTLGSGHVMLVSGTDDSGGKEYVELSDPWPSIKGGRSGRVLYSELLTAFGRGRWKWTWIGIA